MTAVSDRGSGALKTAVTDVSAIAVSRHNSILMYIIKSVLFYITTKAIVASDVT